MAVKAGRMVLALGFFALAAYCVVTFVTMPFELVTSCTNRAVPDGSGIFLLALGMMTAAIIAAFSPDWT